MPAMPKIELSVPHQLSREDVKSRIVHSLAEAQKRFAGDVTQVADSWNGYVDEFSFKAMGFSIAGRLEVEPAQVAIHLQLPWAAYPFKHRIESEILAHARQLLA
jgi:hypothetical protein